MCTYERGPVAKTVYSDNQNNVDALAERLSSQTSLSAERAKLVAYDLLCRKALKIKSSALAQIFRSVDKECDTKAMRDELIAAKIVTKIEGSGVNGRPAFYTINAEIRDVQEQPAEAAEEAVEDVVEAPVAVETAPRENVDTDELLDESVVRAFTAKAGRGGFGGGGDATDVEPVEDEAVTEPQCAAEVQEPKRRRGAHFKAEQGGVVCDVQESVEAAGAPEEPVKKAPGSCRPGRGFMGRAYPARRQEKTDQAPAAPAEKAEKAGRLPSRWSVSRSLLSRGLRAMSSPEASSLRARKRGRKRGRALRASLAVVVTVAAVAQMPRPRPSRQRGKTRMRRLRSRRSSPSASQ